MSDELKGPELANLYRVEMYTDLKCSDIKCLVPVFPNGMVDFERPTRFFSSVNVSIGGMPMEVKFEIPGDSIAAASANFPEAAKNGADAFIAQMQKQRSEKKLVLPAGTLPPVH